MMIQGTTPTVTITMPEDVSSWTMCSVTFRAVETTGEVKRRRSGGATVTKRTPDVTISGRAVSVTLSQAETLALGGRLRADRAVEVQVRGRNSAGQAFATGIMRLRLCRLLEEGVI